jgi:hypothetical protein
MAVLTSANYLFLPWVRQGAAAGIQTVDMSPDQAGVVSVTAKLRVNDLLILNGKSDSTVPGMLPASLDDLR